MDILDQKGIAYESCPGVSACFGAAASLNLEYTLPDVSQSLIITRMAGRTAVPEKESIESFAAHHASMAIYLSTGMLEELSRRLVNGGYEPDTPAALVYKATWSDEEAYICTVRELAAEAGVNPNTVQRALAELEGTGLLHTQRTAGRFVTEDLSVIQSAKEKLARGRTREYLSSMAQLGYSRQQVKALLDTWEEE